MKKCLLMLLFAVLPFLAGIACAQTYQGPGPRADGKVYVIDYFAQFGGATYDSNAPNSGANDTAAWNAALSDAALVGTTVECTPGVYNIGAVNWPEGAEIDGAYSAPLGPCASTSACTTTIASATATDIA